MLGRLFGTDGVRGVANLDLTPELAFSLGRAAVEVLREHSRMKVLIGRDTRISGEMLEAALIAGITSVGGDVWLGGILPTPAVAYLVEELQADVGIMISASHNPFPDNGIKFFSNQGLKLSDTLELAIEKRMQGPFTPALGTEIGRVYKEEGASRRYTDFLVRRNPLDLSDITVVLDCAHGAGFLAAPRVFAECGAKLWVLNDKPDGININVNCGSTHLAASREFVLEQGATVGFAFDGDCDRVLAVDEQGRVVDGDKILAICGSFLKEKGQLRNNTLAATVYSNLGLKEFLAKRDISLVTTKAGDRYVLEAMLQKDLMVGGEQSGHVIFLDYIKTGDGILTALQLLKVMQETKQPLSFLANQVPVYPQQLENVVVKTKEGLQTSAIAEAIEKAEKRLGTEGRIFVRPSGTESLIRVLVEHREEALVKEVVEDVSKVIRCHMGV